MVDGIVQYDGGYSRLNGQFEAPKFAVGSNLTSPKNPTQFYFETSANFTTTPDGSDNLHRIGTFSANETLPKGFENIGIKLTISKGLGELRWWK